MIRDGVTTLHGFAWYVRNRPGVKSPGTGGHPFDGVESKYRRLCWPIRPEESGVRRLGPGPTFLVITPALTFMTFGPPEVGQAWGVEPAEIDGLRTEDGRIRVVGMEPHQTQWGTLAVCEFEASSRQSGGPAIAASPPDDRPGSGR
jgi:hypothetical protein